MSNPFWNGSSKYAQQKKPLSLNKYKFRANYFSYFNSKKEMYLSDLHNQFIV